MGVRIICFSLVLVAFLIILHRQRFTHEKTVYYPSPTPVLSPNQSLRPYYELGSFENIQTPKLTVLDRLTRKRINNYILNHYNQYRFELAFVDLGYTSFLQFHYWSEDNGAFQFEEKIGFSLPERFGEELLNLNINKKKFKFSVKQHRHSEEDWTVTTFNLTAERRHHNVSFNLTHVMRNQQCFTAIRTGDIISHKCYGGMGEGKARFERYISKQQTKRNSIFNPTFNLTRCAFDGFRTSSNQMKWVWATFSGFSKPQFYAGGHKINKQSWLGFNFGSINDESEDFIFINGKIYPVEGLDYKIDEKLKQGDVIFMTADKPEMRANFTVGVKSNTVKDLGLGKVDIMRMEGHWAGWVEGNDGNKIEFYLIAGLVETSNSWF